jgi:hypothetical protein
MLHFLAKAFIVLWDQIQNIVLHIVDNMLARVYMLRGMKPFQFGYTSYKRLQIAKYIQENKFANQNWNNYGFRLDERIIEYPWLFSRLSQQPEIVLDAGSILNFDYLLKLSPLPKKKVFISTLAPEIRSYTRKGISYVFEDLRYSCFRDNFFDNIICVSTIEHIGLDNTLLYTSDPTKKELVPDSYLVAIAEYHRMLKSSGKLYLTLPFGKHEVCGWYQVFDFPMVEHVINVFSPRQYDICFFKYYSDGWKPAAQEDCVNSTTFDYHKTKQYTDDYLAFARSVCCIELVK